MDPASSEILSFENVIISLSPEALKSPHLTYPKFPFLDHNGFLYDNVGSS